MANVGTFQASGVASGMDTTTLINNLVKIQSVSVSTAQSRQSAYSSQISALADIVSKLQALQSSTKSLASNGALSVNQVGTNSGFSVTAGSTATAGRYSVTVNELAQPARARSQAFASSAAPVTGGTLSLGVEGTNYDVTINDGDSLSTVAASINNSGAPVSATVLTTDGQSYLSITRRDTGYPVGGTADAALTITENSTGSQGQALGAAIYQQATNASVTIDGLTFQRPSNTISDALPGTTLTLSKKGGVAEDLVLQNSPTDTQANLQKFVDAYNVLTLEDDPAEPRHPGRDRPRPHPGR